MGVVSLWPLLEPVRRTKSLPELKGQKIAIDLSAWIVGCKGVAVATRYQSVYLRTIFHRTLDLLKCGIRPVFVCDGCIPKIKFDKVRSRSKGRSFGKSGPIFRDRSQRDTTRICRNLFECLGLPCLESEGEGEALCAFLNNEQIVDGCLTSDSDVLLYGARRVYRNYTKKNKVGYLEAYEAKDIHDQMQLDQRALVGLALLLGCDYQVGVPGVGIKTAVRMIREMQKENNDTLQRMLSWRTNQELQDLQEQMDIFNEEKHCNECLHIVVGHIQSGCDLCGDSINVSEDLEGCECSCHSFLQKFVSHEEELKVRQKALIDPNFPSRDVMEEFLIQTESKDSQTDISWQEPNFADLQKFVSEHLHWDGQVLFKKLVPLLIQWKLNSSTFPCLEGLEPLRIVKRHQKNYQLLYEVEWSKTCEDIWTKDATYNCSVERDLFEKCFPEMVGSFEQSLMPAKSAENNEKITISNLPHRLTRSSLKKQGLTLSDIEDKHKDLDNSDNEMGTGQSKMPGRQSKRLVGVKDMLSKVRSIDSADTQTGKDIFSRVTSTSKLSDLIGVCTVKLERIPNIDGMKVVLQSLSVNKELNQDGKKISSVDSEEMDLIEGTNKRSSEEEGIENILNGKKRKIETSNSIQECFNGIGIVDANSSSMDFIMKGSKMKGIMTEGSKSTDVTMEGLNVMDSIVGGSKSTDAIMGSLNVMDSVVGSSDVIDFTVEDSKSIDVTIGVSNVMDSIVGGSKSTDMKMRVSNIMDSIVEDSKSTDMKMKGSNVMDSIAEGSKSTDAMMGVSNVMDSIVGVSNVMDSIVGGSKSTEAMMGSSNVMDSIVEDSKSTDMKMRGSNVMDSIAEGSKSTDAMMGVSNVMDSVVGVSNVMDSIVGGSKSTEMKMRGSNVMDSIAEGSKSIDAMMGVSNVMDSIVGVSNVMDSIVGGSKSTDMKMKGSNVMDSIAEGSKSTDAMMGVPNVMDSIVGGSKSTDMKMRGSNVMDSIVEDSKSTDMKMRGSNVMDSIAEGSKSTDVMIGGSNVMDSIVEGSKSTDVMM